MSAPQIPNLLTGSRRGGRRGGRGAAFHDNGPGAAIKQQDAVVQATDTDANISRISAVQTGYLTDPFAIDFAPSSVPLGGFRRLPIINRGTYARTLGIDRLVDSFLAGNQDVQRQIISLGAGSDTRVFRLINSGRLVNCVYHELDFPENSRKKVAVVQRSHRIRALLGADPDTVFSEDEIHGSGYHLHAIDLRCLDPNHVDHAKRPSLASIRPDLPTLILSECCLTYLQPEMADSVIRYFTSQILHETTPKGLVLYEPINPFDAFGKVMVSNLAARGIVLQTLHKYSSLEAQRTRLKVYGFEHGQRAVDVSFLHSQWIGEAERERIAKVEMLDEVEELNLLMQHYCIAWGWHDGSGSNTWIKWQDIQDQPS